MLITQIFLINNCFIFHTFRGLDSGVSSASTSSYMIPALICHAKMIVLGSGRPDDLRDQEKSLIWETFDFISEIRDYKSIFVENSLALVHYSCGPFADFREYNQKWVINKYLKAKANKLEHNYVKANNRTAICFYSLISKLYIFYFTLSLIN